MLDYIIEQTKKLLSIDSPSGYTREAAEYVMEELRSMGYERSHKEGVDNTFRLLKAYLG
ncbi:hypothetical protein [Acetivibrio ethanolgignens]|uniref:hypothetical protein n=1 Tax=Acetivibrio ethanolgignens TaxID=290052 RepID=UPI0012DE2480|nr:hypothetical protein [Acetivibrio ethanolgignens]